MNRAYDPLAALDSPAHAVHEAAHCVVGWHFKLIPCAFVLLELEDGAATVIPPQCVVGFEGMVFLAAGAAGHRKYSTRGAIGDGRDRARMAELAEAILGSTATPDRVEHLMAEARHQAERLVAIHWDRIVALACLFAQARVLLPSYPTVGEGELQKLNRRNEPCAA